MIMTSKESEMEEPIVLADNIENRGDAAAAIDVRAIDQKMKENKENSEVDLGENQENVCNEKEELLKLQLDSRLVTLLNTAKIGDARTLQKMTFAVKKFLFESSEKIEKRRQSVLLLLEHEDYVPPLLMKCLKTNVTKIPGLVSDALWVLNAILGVGVVHQDIVSHKVDDLVDAGIIPLMTKLASAQDNNVNELAIRALEQIAYMGYWEQMRDSSIAVMSALTALSAKKKNRMTVRMQRMCIHITSALLGQVRSVTTTTTANGKTTSVSTTQSQKVVLGCKDLVDNLPPLRLVKSVIPLLQFLVLNTKDDEILGIALSCLAYGGCVVDSFQYIIDSGILKKVSSLITHSDDIVRFYAITSISCVASINEEKALAFLKSMKGTFGLKEFYRAFTSDNDALVWAADQFFSTAVNAVTGDCTISDFNAVLSSGLVHTLAQCLKPGMHEKHVLGGVWALGRLSTEIPMSQRRCIVDAGALPLLVEQLKNSNEIISSMAAVSIGNLVQEKPLNRDQVVSLGVIPLLIGLINKEGNSLQGLISVLAALELIADVKPCAPPEIMKDLPVALIAVLDNKSIKFPDKLIPGIYSIIGKLCDSGSGGVDIVLESGFLRRLVLALNSGNVDTLAFALESFESISRGTKEQRDRLIDIGAVENLMDLMQHPIKYIRRCAICTLSNLYKGQLSPERRLCIQKMVPQVIVEMSKQDPRENHPAGLAFQNVLSNFKFN